MPLYSYKCEKCGTEQDAIRKIADLEDSPLCCGQKTKQVIVAPMINSNFLGSTKNPGYESPMSGKYITTKKQRNDEMKEFNVIAKD